jgi:HlyD family secretion protein
MNTPNQQPQPTDPNKIAKRKIKPEATPRQVQQPAPAPDYPEEGFGQSVLFQQSRLWSRGIIWTILGITSGLVVWACFAPLEEAVPAQGKLEPTGKVKDVQVPMAGVVKQVLIKEGDKVQAGQKLLSLESTVPQAQLTALQNNLASMTAETRFYRSLLNSGIVAVSPTELAKLNVNPEILALTKSRSSILSENQLYRAELNGTELANLSPEQRQRLQSSRAELASRMSSGQLEVSQVDNQMRENRFKRQGINNLLANSQATIANIEAKAKAKTSQLAAQIAENRTRHQTSQSILKTNQGILNSLKPAGAAGALSRNQVLKQEQEVTSRQSEVTELDQQYDRLVQEQQELLANSRLEIQNQQQQARQYQNDLGQLDQEYNRLGMATNQSREKLKNSFAISRKDLLAKIGDNDKLNKMIVENERKIAEINSQISQATLSLKYQDLTAPVSGTIFDLKAGTPGFVANPAEPVLKIVPDNSLTAKVFITNKDIGFVKAGMPVDVRIDSFPFSEFGDVKGKLESIGSDSLPPDQLHPYERFPATVKLDKQNLVIKGRPVTLQSGMSLSVNIKLRERTVMSIFTDMVMKQGDALKTVR